MSEQILNVVIPPLEQPFTYSLQPDVTPIPALGWRVSVPFGKRTTSGFVVGSPASPLPSHIKIKPLSIGAHDQRCFNSEQLTFFKAVAEYYCVPLSQIIDLAIPAPAAPPMTEFAQLCNHAVEVRGSKQREIVQLIKKNQGRLEVSALQTRLGTIRPALRALSAAGIIKLEQQHSTSDLLPGQAVAWAKGKVALTPEQMRAVGKITAATSNTEFTPFLLHGITGSGKTEVYIEAAQHALASDRSVLVVVPEIALTPQLIDRFRARLGSQIAVLHSALTRTERWRSWWSLLTGRAKIAIGARSAVFAPASNLGLIIVDEEHDSSYKQSDGIRYHARDLAVLRAKMNNCPVVLGSATPSLESFANAKSGKYRLITLAARFAANQSSKIELVDLNTVRPWEMASPHISPKLKQALDLTIAKGQQAFILFNRRGFASFMQCEKCASTVRCPNCSVTLTLHRNRNSLMCHYCGLSKVPGTHCPECMEAQQQATATPAIDSSEPTVGLLVERGAGTEKIFDELQELYPDVAIERLDRDVISDLDSYRGVLERVRRGTTQILVGTQMIAKGHDLPGVTLVGIADCDVGLHLPDFRATERTYQLLTQATGRAGRGELAGHIVLQTRVPKHLGVAATVYGDFVTFAERELASRRNLNYPPYTKILRIVLSSANQERVHKTGLRMRDRLRQFIADNKLSSILLGPTPAPIQRIKTMWRWHIIIKSPKASELNQIMQVCQADNKRSDKLRIIYDMDAVDMM